MTGKRLTPIELISRLNHGKTLTSLADHIFRACENVKGLRPQTKWKVVLTISVRNGLDGNPKISEKIELRAPYGKKQNSHITTLMLTPAGVTDKARPVTPETFDNEDPMEDNRKRAQAALKRAMEQKK